MPDDPTSNPFFRLIIPAAGLFTLTMLIFVTASFVDAPPLNRFLDRHAVSIVVGEVLGVVVVSAIALTVDRVATLRQQRRRSSAKQHSGGVHDRRDS